MVEEEKKKISQTEIYSRGLGVYRPQLKPADIKVLETKYAGQAKALGERRLGIIGGQVGTEVGNILNKSKLDFEKNILDLQNDIQSWKDWMEDERQRYIDNKKAKPQYEERYKERYEEVKADAKQMIKELEISIHAEKAGLNYVDKQLNTFNQIKDNPEKLLETFDKNVANIITSNADKLVSYEYDKRILKQQQKEAGYIPGESSPVGGGEYYAPKIEPPVISNLQLERDRLIKKIEEVKSQGFKFDGLNVPVLGTITTGEIPGMKKPVLLLLQNQLAELNKKIEEEDKLRIKLKQEIDKTETQINTIQSSKPKLGIIDKTNLSILESKLKDLNRRLQNITIPIFKETVKEELTPKLSTVDDVLKEIARVKKEGVVIKVPALGTTMPGDIAGMREQISFATQNRIAELEKQLHKFMGYDSKPVLTAFATTTLYRHYTANVQDAYIALKDAYKDAKKSEKTPYEIFNILLDEYLKSHLYRDNFILPIVKQSENQLAVNLPQKEAAERFIEVFKGERKRIDATNEFIKIKARELVETKTMNAISMRVDKETKLIGEIARQLADLKDRIDKLEPNSVEYNRLVNMYNEGIAKYNNQLKEYSNLGLEVQKVYDRIGYSYKVGDYNFPEIDDERFEQLKKEASSLRERLVARGLSEGEAFMLDLHEQITKEVVKLALIYVTTLMISGIAGKFVVDSKKVLTMTQRLQQLERAVKTQKTITTVTSVITPIAVTSSATMAYINEMSTSGRTDFAIIRGVTSGLITSAIMFPNVYRSYKSLEEVTIARNYMRAYVEAFNKNKLLQQQVIKSQIYSKDFKPVRQVYNSIEDVTKNYDRLPQSIKTQLGDVKNIKQISFQIETTELSMRPYVVVQQLKDKTKFHVTLGSKITKYFNVYGISSVNAAGISKHIAIVGVENIAATYENKNIFDSLEHLLKYASQKRMFKIDSIGNTNYYILTESKIVTTKDGFQYFKLGKDPLQLGRIEVTDLGTTVKGGKAEAILVQKLPVKGTEFPKNLQTTEQLGQYWDKMISGGTPFSNRVIVREILKPTPQNLRLFSNLDIFAAIDKTGKVVITSVDFSSVSFLGVETYSKGIVLDKNQKIIVNFNKANRDLMKYYNRAVAFYTQPPADSGTLSRGRFGGISIKSYPSKKEVIDILTDAKNKGYMEINTKDLVQYSDMAQEMILKNLELKNMLISTPSLSMIRPIRISAGAIDVISSAPSFAKITSIAREATKIQNLRLDVINIQQSLSNLNAQTLQIQSTLTNPLLTLEPNKLKLINANIVKLETLAKNINVTQTIQKYTSALENQLKNKLNTKLLTVTNIEQIKMLKAETDLQLRQLTQQLTFLQNKLKMDQKQLQTQLTKLKQMSSAKMQDLVTPGFGYSQFRPRPGTPKMIVEEEKRKDKIKKDKTKYTGYIKEVRKKGKWKALPGIYSTYAEAMSAGVEHVSTTLRASFRIKKVDKKPNKKINQSVINQALRILTERFYRSQKEPGVWIEKKAYRLSTQKEVKEIQEARRRAESDRKFWFGR